MELLTQEINLKGTTIKLFIRREDLIHPFISGNKFRKLKYNLLQAKEEMKKNLITFGGAFSNHIAAVAYAGKEYGFNTIGIIRGDELITKIQENPTLKFAQECGMKFEFVSRNEYKNKDNLDWIKNIPNGYIIPEGGTNYLAVKGCQEIVTDNDFEYNFICCSVGTGGTISGLINSILPNQKVLGFPSLKGDFLQKDICKFAKNENWELINNYHFGGYAKVSDDLIQFINSFYKEYKIPLDPIYTGKMVFGVLDLINKNYFPNDSRILLIHTGGIQGVEGINNKLRRKNQSIIEFND